MAMSLRLRILIAIGLVLALGSGFGLALAGWHARQWLREELVSAQDSGRLEVTRAFAGLPNAREAPLGLSALIADFDGNRHLQARLLGPGGRVVAASHPEPASAPPGWFADMLRQQIVPARLAAPGASGDVVELRPVYDDDMGALWAEFLDLALVLALALVGGAALVFVVVGRALAPLRAVGRVLPRIGAGDYGARAPERGPPELAALGRGVNEMAGRLAAMRERNRSLEEQILTLQDEERADIARDLHDEIGPHLFAANVDASMAATLIGAGRPEAALEQVRAITTAIAHMQRLVRDILGRLRPPQLAELGLSSAILDLVAFWSARRPDVAFEPQIPDDADALPEPVQETLYRIVQESLSNAVRHGAPSWVRIVMERVGGTARVEIVNDGAPEDGVSDPMGARGFGLTGMAERVTAAGGTLSAGSAGDGCWRVAATLPAGMDAREEAA
jgi:two-component system sensor histidine kinase UhpB